MSHYLSVLVDLVRAQVPSESNHRPIILSYYLSVFIDLVIVKHLYTCMYICKSVEMLCLCKDMNVYCHKETVLCFDLSNPFTPFTIVYVCMYCREIVDRLPDCGGLLHLGLLLWICATHHTWFPVEYSLWYVK